MNTPAYFAIDNVITSDGLVAVENVEPKSLFEIYPNPTTGEVLIKFNVSVDGDVSLSFIDQSGKKSP